MRVCEFTHYQRPDSSYNTISLETQRYRVISPPFAEAFLLLARSPKDLRTQVVACPGTATSHPSSSDRPQDNDNHHQEYQTSVAFGRHAGAILSASLAGPARQGGRPFQGRTTDACHWPRRPRQASAAFRTAAWRCPGFCLNAVCMARTPCVRVDYAAGCPAQATRNRIRGPGQGLFLYHLLTGKMLRIDALKRMLHPPAARAGARRSGGLYPFPAAAARAACRRTRCGLTPASIPRRSLLIPDLC